MTPVFDPNDPGPSPEVPDDSEDEYVEPELTPQEREQREADEQKRAPRSVDEANFELLVADEVLGENDDPMRDRYQLRDGAVRAEGHDTTRVYRGGRWVNVRAEPYIAKAHEIAPPPPKQAWKPPPDRTPRREPCPVFVERFVPAKDIHTEIENALDLHAINRDRIAMAFRDGRPNEARRRVRRLLRDALLDMWANGRSAKLIAQDLGCSRQALETLMGNAPRK
jgi:hypothetical protein